MAAIPTQKKKARDNRSAPRIDSPLIVVGVDGSAPSWDAFAWAAGEALRSNGRIVAVFATSVIEAGEVIGSAPLGYAAAVDARAAMAEELAVEVASRAETLGVEVTFVRGIGDAPYVLTEVARSQRADLIVVGRSAKMLHRLAGSTSRRLAMKHGGPVTVVVP
jgi:nucleotide-binding universal stress UspA family protein